MNLREAQRLFANLSLVPLESFNLYCAYSRLPVSRLDVIRVIVPNFGADEIRGHPIGWSPHLVELARLGL